MRLQQEQTKMNKIHDKQTKPMILQQRESYASANNNNNNSSDKQHQNMQQNQLYNSIINHNHFRTIPKKASQHDIK